jgi:hypothetical protein
MVVSLSPLLDTSTDAQVHIRKAALHVQDAWSGNERIHPREGLLTRLLWLVHLSLHWPLQLALVGLITLTFFEAPAWVYAVGPAALDPSLYPVSGLPLLPRPATVGIEGVLLAVLVVDAACSLGAQGAQILQRAQQRKLLYLTILALALAEATVSASGLWAARWPGVSRTAPLLRLTLLVLQSTTLLAQLDLVRRTVPQVGATRCATTAPAALSCLDRRCTSPPTVLTRAHLDRRRRWRAFFLSSSSSSSPPRGRASSSLKERTTRPLPHSESRCGSCSSASPPPTVRCHRTRMPHHCHQTRLRHHCRVHAASPTPADRHVLNHMIHDT